MASSDQIPANMIRFLVFIPFMIVASNLKAQLFDEKEFYPGVKNIITYLYNGTGDKGFWTQRTLDSLGRVISEKSFRKRDLIKVALYKYNTRNDKVRELDISKINGATRIDTTKTEYRYNDLHEIIYQKTTFNRNLSMEIRFKEGVNDTVKLYEYTSFVYHKDINRIMKHTEEYTVITNARHQIVFFETKDPVTQETVIKRSTYDAQGRLQNQKTEWGPPRRIKPLYAGGPGSNDVSYHYVCDGKGRVRVIYLVVNHKKYKMIRNRYIL